MQMVGNTILVTGGGTGIGRGLAEAFHQLGNHVIIAGRREDVLREAAAANPGMDWVRMDTADVADTTGVAASLIDRYPSLNAVLHSAGIMRNEKLTSGSTLDTAVETIMTNLVGVIALTGALLPHLLKQPRATVLTVTSGIAFVPMFMTPGYEASKAAVHSWTEAVRYQLKETPVQVIELVPPYTATSLMGERQQNDPNAMPLNDYVTETMQLLTAQPDAEEILVERVKPQRNAASGGKYREFLASYNERIASSRAEEWSRL